LLIPFIDRIDRIFRMPVLFFISKTKKPVSPTGFAFISSAIANPPCGGDVGNLGWSD
jgi:hypothetical protein